MIVLNIQTVQLAMRIGVHLNELHCIRMNSVQRRLTQFVDMSWTAESCCLSSVRLLLSLFQMRLTLTVLSSHCVS